jgi:NitT/TauT family transport system substrate-binding protein
MTMRHRSLTPAALALSIIVVVGACSSGGATSSPAGAESAAPPASAASEAPASEAASATPIAMTKVPVQLDFVISATSCAILWGKAKGFFEDAGIDLDLIPGEGSDLALNQIDSGNVDFAFIDGSNYVDARAKDVTKTMALYALQNISSTAIASKEPIENPADMVGKSFGTVAQSSGRQKIPAVLEANGVDPSQVPIELMDFSVLYPTLFEGGIDTAEVGLPGSWEGAKLAAEGQGLELFVKPISDWGYRDYSKLLITSQAMIDENEDLVRRLVGALYAAQTDALANMTPTDCHNLVKEVDPQVEQARAELEWSDVQQFIKDPGPMDDETFQFQLDNVKAAGTETTLTPADLYTNEYIPTS